MRVLVSLSTLMIIAITFAGCGSSEPTHAQAASTSTVEPTATATPSPTATPTPVPLRPEELLKKLARGTSETGYKVEYDLRGNDAEGPMNGTLTLAANRTSRLAAFSGSIGQMEGDFLLIEQPEAKFLCINGQGQKACLKSRADSPSPIPLPQTFALAEVLQRATDDPETKVRDAGRERVAGRNARCLEVTAPSGHGRVCADEGPGAILRYEGDFEGAQTSMRAKNAAPAVNKDFEPPYPVTDLGG